MFEEQEFHLRDYLIVIRKWYWLIMAIALTIVVFSTLIAMRSVPLYQASGRLLIERTTPNIVSFNDPTSANSSYWDPYLVETQINIIRSHAVAKRALEKLGMMNEVMPPPGFVSVESQTNRGLDGIRRFLAQIPRLLGAPEPSKISEEAQGTIAEQRKVGDFLDMVKVTPVRDSQLVDVQVTHLEPEKAANIVNTLMDTYIEYRRDVRTSTSRDAIRWLIDEMESAKQKLADSEAALQAYKEQYSIISFEDRQNISMQKLTDMSEAVNAAKIKRLSLETEYRELQRAQAGAVDSIPQIIRNPLIQELKSKLMGLQAEYLELLKKFREKHPTAEAMKTQITGIEQQLNVEIQRVFQSVKTEYELALAQEQTLANALEEYKQEALDLNQKSITSQVLQKDIESNQRIYNELLQRVKETTITERLETTNIRIVDYATIPTSSIGVNKRRSIQISLLIGLALGIGAAFFLEYWNDKITDPDDFKKHLDIPLLAVIPTVKPEKILRHERESAMDILVGTIVLTDPQSTVAEAYRGLRTQVSFSELEDGDGADEKCSILLITSSEPSEGKSSTTANLGIAMAQSGQKTLIVDCDFRKPKLGRMFHLDSNNFGFTDVIMDGGSNNGVGRAIYSTDIQNLHILPCGTVPTNPSELLSLRKTAAIIRNLQQQYERILIDSPPVNVVADALVLSRMADGVILVVRASKVRKDVVKRARDQLLDADAKIIGGVINNVDMKKARYHYYYYYAYHYPRYYGSDKATKRKHGERRQPVMPAIPSARKIVELPHDADERSMS